MGTVVIGMDPHKRSATIEVLTGKERIVGGGPRECGLHRVRVARGRQRGLQLRLRRGVGGGKGANCRIRLSGQRIQQTAPSIIDAMGHLAELAA